MVLVNCDERADTKSEPMGVLVGCDLVAHLTLVELSDAGLDARGCGNFRRSPCSLLTPCCWWDPQMMVISLTQARRCFPMRSSRRYRST